jgi:hypothetical protein
MHSSGVVRILKDLDAPIAGKHVLLVEDVIDSGLTLSYLIKNLTSRDPASLELCTLMAKPNRRTLPVEPKYVGFEMPKTFVIGYGLDLDEQYRHKERCYPRLSFWSSRGRTPEPLPEERRLPNPHRAVAGLRCREDLRRQHDHAGRGIQQVRHFAERQ